MTSQRPPQSNDFPLSLNPVIHLSPNNKPTNVVVFLPGLGDTSSNFASFPRALNLPDALTITLNPLFPLPYPFGPGEQWSEDLQVDTSTGSLEHDSPLIKATDLVAQELIKKLIDEFGFRPDHVHLCGLGQGGSLALSVLLHPSVYPMALGGLIAIGGPMPLSSSLPSTSQMKNTTPILLLSGSKSSLASADSSPLKRIKAPFAFVKYHQWKKSDDSMPKNRDEVLPMMQFWGHTLKSRRGVPDNAVQVG